MGDRSRSRSREASGGGGVLALQTPEPQQPATDASHSGALVAASASGGTQVIWTQYTSPEGHPYYHQRESNQTVWLRPAGPNDVILDINGSPVLPGAAAAAAPAAAAASMMTGAMTGAMAGGAVPNDLQSMLLASAPGAFGTAPQFQLAQMQTMPQGMQMMPQATTWLRCLTAIGQEYFHNPQTLQTVWERPMGPSDTIVDHPGLAAQHAQQQQLQAVQMQAYAAQLQALALGSAQLGQLPGAFASSALVGLGSFAGVGADDVDLFIAKNRIDANAGSKLKALPPEIRKQVIDRGDLAEARNPNAVLMSRIRDAERNCSVSTGNALPPIARGQGDPALEEFLAINKIDPSAGDKLRALPAEIQKKVMERGNLTDARNPNAMLMGRIRDAQQEVSRGT